MKYIAFMFSGDIDSPYNHMLLQIIDTLDKSKYTPIIFVKNKDGIFGKKISKLNAQIYDIKNLPSVNPNASRFWGFIQSFKASVFLLFRLPSSKIDFFVSAEMGCLLSSSPVFFLCRTSVLWFQESVWENYPIANVWTGFCKKFFASNDVVYHSLPKSIQKYTQVLLPSSEDGKINRSELKKIISDLF